MTIFKEKLDEEYLTVAETKEVLQRLERERAADEDREMRYELARAIEHANLRPRDRDELRALYAQERYSLSGEELDEILEVVAKYV